MGMESMRPPIPPEPPPQEVVFHGSVSNVSRHVKPVSVSLATEYFVSPPFTFRRISVSHRVLHGAPRIVGTRIPVYMILRKLEAGYDVAEIADMYEGLDEQVVRTAIRFAAHVLEILPNVMTSEESSKWWPLYSDYSPINTLSAKLLSGSAVTSQSTESLPLPSVVDQMPMIVNS